MYCYQCATRIDEASSFCRNCGAEAMVRPSDRSNLGWLATSGYFGLGVISYLAIFLAVSLILMTLFPTGGPQLAILLSFVLGALSAGLYVAQVKRNKVPLKGGFYQSDEKIELHGSEVLELPAERFTSVPDSVIETTTSRLRQR